MSDVGWFTDDPNAFEVSEGWQRVGCELTGRRFDIINIMVEPETMFRFDFITWLLQVRSHLASPYSVIQITVRQRL